MKKAVEKMREKRRTRYSTTSKIEKKRRWKGLLISSHASATCAINNAGNIPIP